MTRTTVPAVPPTTATKTTTTTTVARPEIYYLKNNGIGDTRLRPSNVLSTREPDNTTLPNYDTDIDDVSGQKLLPTSKGLSEADPQRKQIYQMPAASGSRLSGPVTGKIWAQLADSSRPVVLRAVLRECNLAAKSCITLAEDATSTTRASWGSVAFEFGSIDHDVAPGRQLMIVLITEEAGAVHVGFDADDAPSYFSLPFE